MMHLFLKCFVCFKCVPLPRNSTKQSSHDQWSNSVCVCVCVFVGNKIFGSSFNHVFGDMKFHCTNVNAVWTGPQVLQHLSPKQQASEGVLTLTQMQSTCQSSHKTIVMPLTQKMSVISQQRTDEFVK